MRTWMAWLGVLACGYPTIGDGRCRAGEAPVPLYLDADGDGVGVEGAMAEACPPLDGYVPSAGDCAPDDH